MGRFGPPYNDTELAILGPELIGPRYFSHPHLHPPEAWARAANTPCYAWDRVCDLREWHESQPLDFWDEMEFYRRTSNVVAISTQSRRPPAASTPKGP